MFMYVCTRVHTYCVCFCLMVTVYECMYLLCCIRWQELDGITLISRDATRQENGILFCIVGHEGDQTLNLINCECIFGPSPAVAMDPGCKAGSKITGFHVFEEV